MGKPIVLIVDDDPDFGMRLKKSFANAANWGCLFVDDLAEAYDIVVSQRYDIKILLTDWHFERGTERKLGLLDGVDLVEKVQAAKPSVECFLMTAQQKAPNFQAKASKLTAVRIMFKMDFELASAGYIRESFAEGKSPDSQPWNVIESNVVPLFPTSDEEAKISNHGEQFDTFIQEMPVGFRVSKPIPIVVKVDHDDGGGYFRASSPQLGILVEGFGDDPMEAIDELKEVIIGQLQALSEEQELHGLAALSKKLLGEHITVGVDGGKQEFHYG